MGYNYYMGKYEVTNAQYCQFLNAKLPTLATLSQRSEAFCPVTRTACITLNMSRWIRTWWNRL